MKSGYVLGYHSVGDQSCPCYIPYVACIAGWVMYHALLVLG